jgi:hypothetical protein
MANFLIALSYAQVSSMRFRGAAAAKKRKKVAKNDVAARRGRLTCGVWGFMLLRSVRRIIW